MPTGSVKARPVSSDAMVGAGPSPSDRDRLMEEFAPVIKRMAKRMAFRLPPYLDVDDLIQVGAMGLLDAIGRYDPKHQASFSTYVQYRIRGAMLDEIRSLNWVPRSVRDKVKRLYKAFAALDRCGKTPTEEAVAELLGMSPEEYDAFLLEAKAIAVLHIEDLGLDEDDEPYLLRTLANAQSPDALAELVSLETKFKIVDAVNRLSPKEKQVISLYYDDELTMKEIGQILGVTESRVCQIHTQAVLRLRSKLSTQNL